MIPERHLLFTSVLQALQCSAFHSTTNRFQVTVKFEANPPNDLSDLEKYKIKGTPYLTHLLLA